jgi:hypothetical protein
MVTVQTSDVVASLVPLMATLVVNCKSVSYVVFACICKIIFLNTVLSVELNIELKYDRFSFSFFRIFLMAMYL